MINALLQLVAVPAKVESGLELSPFPLRLSITGKRFSGKKSLAKRIAESCGISLLVISELITESIKYNFLSILFNFHSAFETNEVTVPALTDPIDAKSKKPVPSSRSTIGSQIHLCLKEGS